MYKFLFILLLSPIANSSNFLATDAIEVIKKDLHRVTSLKSKCIDFYLLSSGKSYGEGLIEPLTNEEALARSIEGAPKNNEPFYFTFDLRERHNQECGGDPEISPRITTISVSRKKMSNKIIARASHFFCDEVNLDEYSIGMDCPLRKYCVYPYKANSSGEIEGALQNIDDDCPPEDEEGPLIRSYLANPRDR